MRRFVKPKYTYSLTPFPEQEEWEDRQTDEKNERIARANRHYTLHIHGGNRIKNKARRRLHA